PENHHQPCRTACTSPTKGSGAGVSLRIPTYACTSPTKGRRGRGGGGRATSAGVGWVVSAPQGVAVLAVPPHSTSQRCAGCRALVRTSLSVRTHRCPPCGLIAVRDHHAAVAIREAWVTLVIAHVLWDPVRHGLLPRGPGPAKGRESECGTVGHPGEPHRV